MSALAVLVGRANAAAPTAPAAPASDTAPTAHAAPSDVDLVLNAPVVGMAPTPDGDGYWLAAGDGGIFTFGDAGYFGSAASEPLNKPIVGIAPTPDGDGYWEVAADGGVFTYGDARFYGSTGGIHLRAPVVDIVPTADGAGYWLVASDGGVFTYGDARFHGSGSSFPPTSPVVGLAPTSDGLGYWLVTQGGAMYAFGDAAYSGNVITGSPIVGITRASKGYQLANANGTIFAMGGAPSYGMASEHLNMPIIGIAPTAADQGYWLAGADGGVFAFGDAQFYGSLGGSTVKVATAAALFDDGDTPAQIAAWDKVNICEEGGAWNVDGPVYSGGLGFSHANWARFNTFGYPADAADATPDEQIRVAVAFATAYLGGPNAAPDQNGCDGGY
jgi:Transglycosylase-like domain